MVEMKRKDSPFFSLNASNENDSRLTSTYKDEVWRPPGAFPSAVSGSIIQKYALQAAIFRGRCGAAARRFALWDRVGRC
jgi:hypothetical protein